MLVKRVRSPVLHLDSLQSCSDRGHILSNPWHLEYNEVQHYCMDLYICLGLNQVNSSEKRRTEERRRGVEMEGEESLIPS